MEMANWEMTLQSSEIGSDTVSAGGYDSGT